jgi:predicted ribonuclease YlaK
MEGEKTERKDGMKYLISDQVFVPGQQGKYEVAFRRWIVRELESGRMTEGEVVQRFGFDPKAAYHFLRHWRKQYGSEIVHTLPLMNEKERLKVEALQKQNQQLIKQLEDAQMKNIALETLIDVAEESLKIKIRKKAGPKQ